MGHPVSLVDRSLMIVGMAAAVAVATPFYLLRDDTTPPPAQSRTGTTVLRYQDVSALTATLERPAFSPTRSVVPMADVTEPGAVEPTAAPSPVPTLAGLITGGRRAGLAILRSASGESVNLRVGGEIDGWRLVSLDRSRAVVEQAGQRETLTLSFPNRDQAATGVPSGAGGSNQE